MHAFRLTRTETAPMVTTEPVVAPLIITCDQAEPQQAEVPDTVSDAPTSVGLLGGLILVGMLACIAGTQPAEPQQAESQHTEPQQTEPQQTEPQHTEPQQTEQQQVCVVDSVPDAPKTVEVLYQFEAQQQDFTP
jgi:hypothetical protein